MYYLLHFYPLPFKITKVKADYNTLLSDKITINQALKYSLNVLLALKILTEPVEGDSRNYNNCIRYQAILLIYIVAHLRAREHMLYGTYMV